MFKRTLKKIIIFLFPQKWMNFVFLVYEKVICQYVLPIFKYGLNQGINIISQINKSGDIEINLKNYGKIILRDNFSDRKNFVHIFIKNEYKLNLDFKPSFIVDGGAYIGLSSLYFNFHFPEALIIAVEPDFFNFIQLKKNTCNNPNIYILNNAIWSDERKLSIKDIGLGRWGLIVYEDEECSKNTISTISITSILKKFNKQNIDILKLDIEGSEREVFSNNYRDWLPKVKYLIIEFHDRLIPDCSKIVREALREFNFEEKELGQNHLFINKSLIR